MDLVVNGFWPVGSRQAGGLHGIRRSTQCVRAHMADTHGLTGGSGGSSSRGIREALTRGLVGTWLQPTVTNVSQVRAPST